MIRLVLSCLIRLMIVANLIVPCLLCIPSGVAYADDASVIELEGQGTIERPYLIATLEDMKRVQAYINAGNDTIGVWFALVNDIDYGGSTVLPFANPSQGSSFRGGFDGRGHKLSGFVIKSPNESASFFGRIDGVVENVELIGLIEGRNAASFANDGHGVILNSVSDCEIKGDALGGGIANHWNGSIVNTVFQGAIVAPKSAGIVNDGDGNVDYVFESGYGVGDIASVGEHRELNQDDSCGDISTLDAKALQLFNDPVYSIYGKCLNRWLDASGRLTLSSEIAAFIGTGAENDPYIVSSLDKLKALMKLLESGCGFDDLYFLQTADFDLAEENWSSWSDNSAVFLGVYDGGGHTIFNLRTGDQRGGLFRYFDGMILNLRIENCITHSGCGFAGSVGGASMILNSYCSGEIGDIQPIVALHNVSQLENCYIAGYLEPRDSELTEGLKSLVVHYGIHCGELYTWSTGDDGNPAFSENYRDDYLNEDRRHWSGTGVENDPYQISSLDDFVYLREMVYYSDHFFRYWFKQQSDLDFSEVLIWKAVADETTSKYFFGNYDGDGFKMVGFHSDKEEPTESSSLFGNVCGRIFNVHMSDCYIMNGGGGILVYELGDTGVLFDNIIEVSNQSTNSPAVGIVYMNQGCVLNNIVAYAGDAIGIVDYVLTSNPLEKEGLPKTEKNQFVRKIDQNTIHEFNENMMQVALELKRRVTNFNILSEMNGETSLRQDIEPGSEIDIAYHLEMLRGNILLLASIVWTAIACIYLLTWMVRSFLNGRRPSKHMLTQTAICSILYLFFLVGMARLKSGADVSIGFAVVSIAIVTLGVLCIYGLMRKNHLNCLGHRDSDRLKEKARMYTPLGVVLIVTAILVIAHFDTPIAYDADLYYGSFQQAIQNFGFSIRGFAESFIIASKPMHGAAMLMVIGECLDPGTGTGIYIVNLILLLLSQYCMFAVVRKLFPKFSIGACALFSAIYALSAYVIAGATYINPDFYATVFFAMFICCVLYKLNLFALVSGMCFMCAKPNMAVSYLLFISVLILFKMKSNSLNKRTLILFSLPLSVYFILYFGINVINLPGEPASSDNMLDVILESRLQQYFSWGLIWIQELIIIAALIQLVRQRRVHFLGSFKCAILFGVWLACITQLFIIILSGETLQLCPRYLTICAVKNVVLLAMAADVLSVRETIKKVGFTCLAALLFIQVFVTIDPWIYLTARGGDDGLYYLTSPQVEKTGNDLAFYNYEYSREARDGTAILKSLDDSQIDHMLSSSKNKLGYKTAIENSGIYAVYWDLKRGIRTYIPNENTVRLGLDTTLEELDSREVSSLDNYTIILRESDNRVTVDELRQKRESRRQGPFVIFPATAGL